MKSAIIRMREYHQNASQTEKSIIKFILDNPKQVTQYTVHDLAEKSYSSASTIVRLCKKIGMNGYKELIKCLVYELAVRDENVKKVSLCVERTDSTDEIIDKVTFRNIASLDNTRKLITQEDVCRGADLICNCDTINLFGIGASYLVAQDAYLKFLRVNKRCCLSEDIHSQYLHAVNIKPNDLAILISYSGSTHEINRCAHEIKKNGAPIIAITRFADSELARLADCCLYVSETEELFRSGAMPSRIAQLNIIDILYMIYINRNYEECVKQFECTQILKNELKGNSF